MKMNVLSMLTVCLLAGCGNQSSQPPAPLPEPQPQPQPEPGGPTLVPPPAQIADFIGFESAPVRPIAQSADGQSLYVTNTSNNSLEVFSLTNNGQMTWTESIPVGLEPVAVATSQHWVYVVNHLSDSISVIDTSTSPAKVVRTLLVGDEPKDIVISGSKLFVTTAHRGQQRMSHDLADVPGAGDPNLHKSGQGRADIWVFDINSLGTNLGGKPLEIISMFGDTLRGLALSNDGQTLYAGVLNSGNQTTAVHEAVMCYGYEDDEYGAYPCQVLDGMSSPQGLEDGYLPGGRTSPGTNVDGEYQPWTSMIVQYDPASGQWQDSKGRNFSNGIRFHLPDNDVFAIDVNSHQVVGTYNHVGTTLFNLAVDPASDTLLVTNTEANNATRFEGPGQYGGSTVQGNIAKSQISVIEPISGVVAPRQLNRHIDYQDLKGNGEIKQHSLSTPTQMAITDDGEQLFVAAMGSDKVAVLPMNQVVEQQYWDGQGEEFDPTKLSQNYLTVRGGPVGLFLDETKASLYVFTRFDNSVVRVNLTDYSEAQRISMMSNEPESYQAGRFMLYDANRSSSNGEQSCASCHVFGDTDHLSWNLGNPDASNGANPQPFPTQNLSELGCFLVGPEEESCQLLELINGNGDERSFASMKGPMATQTLRGMQHHGHMHWRGDRSVGYFGDDIEQSLDERVSFKNFIVAFEGLLGLDIELPATVDATNKSADVVALEQDMDKFADFMMRVALPPNPIRGLDNSLSTSASLGHQFFHGTRRSDGAAEDTDANGTSPDGVNCEGCHGVDPSQGFYGTRGEIAHGGEIQIFKVPQLRNLYTRVGMFGLPDREGFLPSHTKAHQGDQIRGFGFLHDGATDQLLNFLKGGVFDNGETGCPEGADARFGCHFNEGEVGIPDEVTRQGLVDYMMEFDNDLAPIVGQQATLSAQTREAVITRILLLEQRAATPFVSKLLGGEVTECDLIAKGVINGQRRGYIYRIAENLYRSDDADESLLTHSQLVALATQETNQLTYTCSVPGQGWQAAIDHDLDGILNANEEH